MLEIQFSQTELWKIFAHREYCALILMTVCHVIEDIVCKADVLSKSYQLSSNSATVNRILAKSSKFIDGAVIYGAFVRRQGMTFPSDLHGAGSKQYFSCV